MQQYSDVNDSKACHRRFNAKSNVHSMNNIRAPEAFLFFFVDQCLLPNLVLALDRTRSGLNRPARPISSAKAVFYTDLRAVPFSMQYTQRETIC